MSLRWTWSVVASFLTVAIAVVLASGLVDIEYEARQADENEQRRITVSILSKALAMPMMANSRVEVDALLEAFLEIRPDTRIHLHWASGADEQFGRGELPEAVRAAAGDFRAPLPIQGTEGWYAGGIQFNGVGLGSIAVYLPGSDMQTYLGEVKLRLTLMALLLALFVGAVTYHFSGKLSHSMRRLSGAAKKVGKGDFLVHIPAGEKDEVGQAMMDFNQMVSQLAQRQSTQALFGRYAAPQQVSDAFDRKLVNTDCPARNVVAMALCMVDFPGYVAAVSGKHALAELNRFFDMVDGIVSACGGHIDHLGGDRLLAVFNHPSNLKNYEQQAAKAAMAVIEVSKKLLSVDTDGRAAVFRVGLVQGEVATGYLGAGRHREFRVVGAALTLAEQLAMQAGGHEVLLAGELLQQLGHGFIQQDVGVKKLAGGHEMHCALITGTTQRLSTDIEAVVAATLTRAETAERPDR